MPRIDQRTALDVLAKPRLLAIAGVFGLDVSPSWHKPELVDALAGSRRAPFWRILDHLSRDELKAICRAAAIDDSGREKLGITERILKHGLQGTFAPRASAPPSAEPRTLTKADLVEDVAAATRLTKKDAEVIVNAMFTAIVEALKDGSSIELRGFGSFRLRDRGPRVGRNPKTGAKVMVPAKRVPYFRPSKEIRKLISS